jgi:Transposase, Mutator family
VAGDGHRVIILRTAQGLREARWPWLPLWTNRVGGPNGSQRTGSGSWPPFDSAGMRAWAGEPTRCSDVVGIFPNDAALLRLAGMLLIEQNDEWLVGRRYLSESSMALLIANDRPDLSATTGTQEVAQLTAP